MNFIKDRVTAQTTRGIFINSGSISSSDLAGVVGFDWVFLDMEHGLGDQGAVLAMIRALGGSPTAPVVRIPALREEYVKLVLDFGAAGIMCPMIRSAAEARELVTLMRYPPAGRRGMASSSRAAAFGTEFEDYFARANADLLCVVQVETREAVAEIDAIAATPGVDVLFIGHSDLSLALDCFGQFEHPEMVRAERAVLEAARNHGKTAGMLLRSGMDRAAYEQRGFRFLALGSDIGCLRAGYEGLLSG
jgi:4-hydroxy-2-oxoheptanedioate aldolase